MARRARHTRPALKVLHPQFSARTDIVKRFFNEARAATAINDPGIVQIFDFGQHTDGSAYIVMELHRNRSGGLVLMRTEHRMAMIVTTWVAASTGCSFSALPRLGASDGGVTDAPRNIDGPDTDAADIDAALPVFKNYNADEGGEVRVEYLKFANGNAGTRVTAFFFKNPGTIKYHAFLSQNGCTDMRDLARWPMATNPIAEREYYDAGTSIVLVGGPSPLTVPKKTTTGRAPFNREHPADQWYSDPATATDNDGGTYLTEKTLYDVVLSGSSSFPGATFDNAIYMPAAFDLNDSSHPHMGPLTFPANTAQTFTWTTPADTAPAGLAILSMVAFTGANGPAVICVEPNDGSVTVPAAMMDVARTAYPTGGILTRQTFTHAVRELADATGLTKRRVDLIGVWNYGGTMYVTE